MSPRTKEQNQQIQEKTRRQILMAALEAFANRGYTHTSVSYLAQQAGISKGLIYHYFASKEDVLLGIFNMLIEEGQHIIDDSNSTDARDQLRNTIDQSISFIEQQTDIMRFMYSLALQPEVLSSLEDVMERERKKAIARFNKIFAALGYEDPEKEAFFAGAILDGAGFGFMGMKNYPMSLIRDRLYEYYKL